MLKKLVFVMFLCEYQGLSLADNYYYLKLVRNSRPNFNRGTVDDLYCNPELR